MNLFESAQELRRLQELYSQKCDDELMALAQDGDDLTDAAREALQSEISTRGLKVQIQDEPKPEAEEPSGDFNLSDSELAHAGSVWSLDEARQYKKILDDARIPSYFGPDNVDDLNALHADFDKGVEVKVWEPQQQLAFQVLRMGIPPEPNQEATEEEDYEAHCPKCHSTEIVLQGLDGDVSESSTLDSRFNWSCDACGYQWKDDGVEA